MVQDPKPCAWLGSPSQEDIERDSIHHLRISPCHMVVLIGREQRHRSCNSSSLLLAPFKRLSSVTSLRQFQPFLSPRPSGCPVKKDSRKTPPNGPSSEQTPCDRSQLGPSDGSLEKLLNEAMCAHACGIGRPPGRERGGWGAPPQLELHPQELPRFSRTD